MDVFHRATRNWFQENFTSATRIQQAGWPAIARGGHVLLIAPTGSGKTLAAFLYAIDKLMRTAEPGRPGIQLLYISPLKALVHDIERNLRGPLAGIALNAERLGDAVRPLAVDVRTGDTPARERERQRRKPGDILVTTPESLYLMLGSRYRENFRSVATVVVDEVHALAPVKRGSHLALSLERLSALSDNDPQRIGLSATVRPAQETAAFLAGSRPVEIIDCAEPPRLDLKVVVPVPDMENVPAVNADDALAGGSILASHYAREVGTPPPERGIWSAIYPQILEHILANRAVIVFVNSRGLCERLSQRINDLAGEELVRAHHGSVSHQARAQIEDSLKRGQLRGIVATSSLELGIDMGSVDLVLQVESPGAVSRGLQRVGRAGHQVQAVSSGRIFPKYRGDLLECTVIAQRMLRGEIESTTVPTLALDVLAQQIVAMVCDQEQSPAEILVKVRRAYPYRDLSEQAITAVIEMLSGHYPSEDFADLRSRLVWNRTSDQLSARRGTAMVTRMNAGTIPDRGQYTVHLGEGGPRVGELDEEMVFETRPGERITLGASTWRVEGISRDRVIVAPDPGEPGRLPFWRGDGPGRPIELGMAIGAFVRELESLSPEDMVEVLMSTAPLDRFAAGNLAQYLTEQKSHAGSLPTDKTISIERFKDELGDWRVCVLTPFGARVHAPWAMAIARQLSSNSGFDVQIMYTDDGIVLRLADTEEPLPRDALTPSPEDVRDLVTEQLADTALFAGLFRENAARSLLITRRRPGERSPLWAQRQKAQALLAAVRKYSDFPIVLETYRQALGDVFDLPALESVLSQIRNRTIQVHEVETATASPFARSLVFSYVAAYIYEQDQPLAERRAQALTLDRNLLAELLGQAELRELLDADVMDAVEAQLQGLGEGRQARDADELHDLLRRIGDLSADEVRARCAPAVGPDSVRPASAAWPSAWLQRLVEQGRAIAIKVTGETRYVCAEDAGTYRDAVGSMPPAGLPDAYTDPVPNALERIVRRYARSHGPFLGDQLAARYGLTLSHLEPCLLALEQGAQLLRGELRPGGSRPEWCDPDVLRQIKRRTLAMLRNQIAALAAPALARFLPRWQRIGGNRRGFAALEESLLQLEGLALPWSSLIETILPARVRDFSIDMLDALCARGQVIWLGQGALGPRDGRVAIYRRAQAERLVDVGSEFVVSDGSVHASIIEHLRTRGASFVTDLESAVRQALPEVQADELSSGIWDLVWAGLITNDTFAPLRGLRTGSRKGARRGAASGRYGNSNNPSVMAGGRWDLVHAAFREPDDQRQITQAAIARAGMLLERYGIVSREAAAHEALAGGFTPVYKALGALEESGKIRRGYFIEGLSGAQFAYPGAVDRLRAEDRENSGQRVPGAEIDVPARAPTDSGPNLDQCNLQQVVGLQAGAPDADSHRIEALLAVDPANPFGALLPWPVTGDPGIRPRRAPAAWVVLADGHPTLYLAANGKQLLTFAGPSSVQANDADEELLAACLRALLNARSAGHGRRRGVSIERIDNQPVGDAPLGMLLLRNGFVRDYRGYTWVKRP